MQEKNTNDGLNIRDDQYVLIRLAPHRLDSSPNVPTLSNPTMWNTPAILVGGLEHEFYFPQYMGCHPFH